MSDFLKVFDISSMGMRAERMRLEVSASNLANAFSVKAPDGSMYRPQRVVATSGTARASFDAHMQAAGAEGALLRTAVVDSGAAPRRVQQPDHPYADKDGFIEMPAVDPALEMSEIMTAVRAYEADVKVSNAAKSMMMRALEIGER